MPAKVSKVRWKCPQCQKSIWLKPFQIVGRKYCSRECHYAATKVEKPVRQYPRVQSTYGEATCRCGEVFVRKGPGAKYCSRPCALDAIHERKIDPSVTERACEACGNLFRPRPRSAGRFCSRACTHAGQTGKGSANFKGGRIIKPNGYVDVLVGGGTYQLEHRHVMEQHLGRALLSTETVHHINGVKDDNRIENLELWEGRHGKGQRARDPHCPTCTCHD